jgi:hypothetical protein
VAPVTTTVAPNSEEEIMDGENLASSHVRQQGSQENLFYSLEKAARILCYKMLFAAAIDFEILVSLQELLDRFPRLAGFL